MLRDIGGKHLKHLQTSNETSFPKGQNLRNKRIGGRQEIRKEV
jgi:hypothetical protein